MASRLYLSLDLIHLTMLPLTRLTKVKFYNFKEFDKIHSLVDLVWCTRRVHNCVVCYLGQTSDALIRMLPAIGQNLKNKMSTIFIFNSELASDLQIGVIPKSVLCSVIMRLLSGDIVNTYITPLINTEFTGMNTVSLSKINLTMNEKW